MSIQTPIPSFNPVQNPVTTNEKPTNRSKPLIYNPNNNLSIPYSYFTGRFITSNNENLFLLDYHGRTYLRRIISAIVLLVIDSWSLAQYRERKTPNGESLLTPVVLTLFVLNIIFFSGQVVLELWLIMDGYYHYKYGYFYNTSKYVSNQQSTSLINPKILPPMTTTTTPSSTTTPSLSTTSGTTSKNLPFTKSSLYSSFLYCGRIFTYLESYIMCYFPLPYLRFRPTLLITSGLLDYLWLFQIIFAIIAHQISLITLCNDPVRSLILRQCQTWKLSFIPVSPFLVCWAASCLILLLSTLPLANFIALNIVFGITTALWIILYQPTPTDLSGFNPATSTFTTNIFPPGTTFFQEVQSRSNAFAIVLFISVWILLDFLVVLIPRILRMNYSLRLLQQQQFILYKESTHKKEKATRKALYARMLAIRATTASIVADATIGYTFHALKNPLHVLTILMDEWLELYYNNVITNASTTTGISSTTMEPAKTTVISTLTLPVNTKHQYIPISIEDLDIFTEALSRLHHTTEEAGIHNSLLGRRIKNNPQSVHLPEFLSFMIRESLRHWEQELYVLSQYHKIFLSTLPVTIPFYTIDSRIYTRILMDHYRLHDVLKNGFRNAFTAAFTLMDYFCPTAVQQSLQYDTETNRQRYLRQQSIRFFTESFQETPEIMDQCIQNHILPYPVSLQLSLVSRPYLHGNEIFSSPTAVIADGSRGIYYTPQPLPYPLPDNFIRDKLKILRTQQEKNSPGSNIERKATTATISEAERGISPDSITPFETPSDLEIEEEGTPSSGDVLNTSLPKDDDGNLNKKRPKKAFTARDVHPFVRFEIINVGHGLPHNETARSLFAPFLVFRSTSKSSDRSREETAPGDTKVIDGQNAKLHIVENVVHRPQKEEVNQVAAQPILPLSTQVPREENSIHPPLFVQVSPSQVPRGETNYHTPSETFSPVTPFSSKGLDLQEAEEKQLEHIYRTLRQETAQSESEKTKYRSPAHDGAITEAVPPSSPRPTITDTDNAQPTLSSSSHDNSLHSDTKPSAFHVLRSSFRSSNKLGGLHWHTRNTGLGLPIVRLTAELLHGYCGLYDDPDIIINVPETSTLSVPTTNINSNQQGKHNISNTLKVTRFFFEIPYEKGAPSIEPSSFAQNFALAPHFIPTQTVPIPIPPTITTIPTIPVIPAPPPPPIITTQQSSPVLPPIEASPGTFLAYLHRPLSTHKAEHALTESTHRQFFPSPVSTPGTPALTVPTLPIRKNEPIFLEETEGEGKLTSTTVLPPPSTEVTLPKPSIPMLTTTTIIPSITTIRTPLSSTASLGTKPFENLRILVVDDEEVVRRVSTRLLTKLGARVDTLSDGDEVLSAVKQANQTNDPYDAILLDVIMRRVNGDIVVKELRKAGYTSLPVFAASANISVGEIDKYLDDGFTAMLGKPFTKDTVINLFKKYQIIP